MKKTISLFIIGLILQAILISKAVAYSGTVSQLEKKTNSLAEDNQKLELLIASKISCLAIAQKATEAGFAPLAIAEPKVDLSVVLRR
jgi:hypothetical protein